MGTKFMVLVHGACSHAHESGFVMALGTSSSSFISLTSSVFPF